MRRTYARLAASLITVVVVAGACADEEEGGDTGATTAEGSTAEGTGTTAAAGSATTTAGGGGAGGGGRLDAVKEADELTCGSRSDLPGFAETNADGEFEGFDVDFCRAMAAGLLGDAEKATLVDVSTDDRLIALAAGDFDVLTRNTTLTASRDGAEGAMFLQPNYYDGQRMMVAADADISTLEDMDGATICVA
ncbi:MAG: transporter substrate-binding domain-containing protein, partial [Acidimicrobiia bacterium]|nr:transporter substrate-binding domain-containing protein [Acidimicrobiia bacterium]